MSIVKLEKKPSPSWQLLCILPERETYCIKTVAGFNELRIKDKLIKEIVIKESAKKIQVINDVGKKGIWQKTMQTIKETSIFEISKYGIW